MACLAYTRVCCYTKGALINVVRLVGLCRRLDANIQLNFHSWTVVLAVSRGLVGLVGLVVLSRGCICMLRFLLL